MIDWLKQQYNDLLFKLFPVMPSYIAKECYEEFDENIKEFRIMNENKRFIIANYPSDIEDTLTGKKYAMSSYYTHMEIICDLLNELNDENEQLKSDRNYWKTLAQSLAKSNGKR